MAALKNVPKTKATAAPSPSFHDRGNTDTDGAESTRRGRSKKRQAWGAVPAAGASTKGAEAEATGEGEGLLPPPSLEIFEIGGGYGTNALCILEYMKREAPQVYARTRYRIVEISGCVGLVLVMACVVCCVHLTTVEGQEI